MRGGIGCGLRELKIENWGRLLVAIVALKGDCIVGIIEVLGTVIELVAGGMSLWAVDPVPPKAQAPTPVVEHRKTAEGIEYGVWRVKKEKPAATLFILASTIDVTLGEPYYRQAGNALSEEGVLCVSIDLPCHGAERRGDEPEGIAGWSERAAKGENFMVENNRRLSRVLDDLIARGETDPERVAACGTSRGGFAALHFAAAEPRVKCVAGFCPVADLAALQEFQGREELPLVKELALLRQADALAGRGVWLIIGDRDDRVDTDRTIALARGITAAALRKNLSAKVDLHVVAEPQGHTTPAGSAELGARWIGERWRE